MLGYLLASGLALASLVTAWRLRRVVRHRRRRWRIAPGLMVSLSLLLLTLAVTETVFRYFMHQTDSHMRSRMSQKWKKKYVQWNRAGFRDHHHERRAAADTFRIAVLGDSLTFGVGIKDPADRFTERLERTLNAGGHGPVELLNMGRVGASTRGQIAFYQEDGAGYQPDLVLLAYFVNDIVPAPLTPLPPRGAALDWLMEQFYLIDFFYWQLAPSVRRAVKEEEKRLFSALEDEATLDRHGKELTQLQAISKENGHTRFLILLMPVPIPEARRAEGEKLHQAVRRLMEKNQLRYLDLWKEMETMPVEQMTVSRWDGHPSRAAHRRIAELLAAYLVEHKLLTRLKK